MLKKLMRLGGAGQTQTQERVFVKTLTELDLNISQSDFTVGPDYTRIGYYVIPPQQMWHYGYGNPTYPDNQGHIYLKLRGGIGATDIDGLVRFVQENALGTQKLVVSEFRTTMLDGSMTDKRSMVALPEQIQFPWVGEDSRLSVEFRPDNTTAINRSSSVISIPVTVRY
ncbi:MAG: hypothetical protein EFT35_07780 [Methanophagales archaeon ANME-1-THS]|nr:MAG: hypothetical protein EFT35_07780 [Methanophagales archaeon ANME-1-THS]